MRYDKTREGKGRWVREAYRPDEGKMICGEKERERKGNDSVTSAGAGAVMIRGEKA